MNDFLPKNEDLNIPSSSNYMSFQNGENKFRILGSFADGSAIRGSVYWKTIGDKRAPVRVPVGASIPVGEMEINKFGQPDRPRHFWALPVYNYQDKKIQILEITQKSILRPLLALAKNSAWGDPKKYDLVVTRSEEAGKTIYTLTANPPTPLEDGIMQVYKDMHINTKALFSGGDPFLSAEGEDQEETEVDIDEIDKILGS